MNELGEAAVSSAITAHIECISGNTLLINVLCKLITIIKYNTRLL